MENTTTDPDCGVFHKGEHKNVFAYTANVACDRHNYILGFEATAGNLHNSTVFPLLYGKLKSKYEGIKNVMVNTQWIIVLLWHQELGDIICRKKQNHIEMF